MPELAFTLNGQAVRAGPGTLLAACAALGAEVPTLCHDPRLAPASACRLCEVEVDGHERNPCACATPLEAGMVVRTHTDALESYRRGVLQMLARHYPPDAVEAMPQQPFHRWLRHYGVAAEGARDAALADATHPYIRVDLSQCIDCYRCVRICEEVQGRFVWKVEDRGARTRVVAEPGGTLLKSPCVSCGACVDACPTGALADAGFFDLGPAERWTRTTCPYCGTGCELAVGVKEDRIVASRPVMDAPVSRGHLCVKGRYGTAFVDAPDRVLKPMVRAGGRWREVSWDEALDAAADALLRIGNEHGADALGFLGSSRATNEEAYLVQKLARLAAGTNNVDCCARVCHAPSAAGLGQVFGTGAATNSFDDIERAALLLVVGSNATENHPIVGARIKQRALAGVPLIVIDPRRIELAEHARIHLAPRPGTNLPLLLALARVILDEGLEDRAFIESRTE
ncbi:MAG TPA: molybdopterin-dependent oxidoreductase, partial [Holophagaceae bacterium]|nr:molybdopterin-dependent oxidoreductase [Holophagaceae bacterium]